MLLALLRVCSAEWGSSYDYRGAVQRALNISSAKRRGLPHPIGLHSNVILKPTSRVFVRPFSVSLSIFSVWSIVLQPT